MTGGPELFDAWDGRLDEWLDHIARGDPDGPSPNWHYFSFPTPALLTQYIETIDSRSDNEIRQLLRWFLFPPVTLGSDESFLEFKLHTAGQPTGLADPPEEYFRALVRSSKGPPAQPGLRWTIDLLPNWPHAALRVIESYVLVYGGTLPDGRLEGLGDASTVIRAKYIDATTDQSQAARAALTNLRPRELEQLTAAAYAAAGYEVRLTKQTRDGGRDVEASIERDGMRQKLLIECKQWTGPVGVDQVRALAGVVHDERATAGVLLTTGTFSPDALAFVARTHQLHLMDGAMFGDFLAAHLGARWSARLERYLWTPRERLPVGLQAPTAPPRVDR